MGELKWSGLVFPLEEAAGVDDFWAVMRGANRRREIIRDAMIAVYRF